MADLKRVPGCHVYWGTAPLAAGVEKLPKEKVIIFNIDADADLKDVPTFKTPLDKERPIPLSTFDDIVKSLNGEGDKTQVVFNSKEEIPATVGTILFLIHIGRYLVNQDQEYRTDRTDSHVGRMKI